MYPADNNGHDREGNFLVIREEKNDLDRPIKTDKFKRDFRRAIVCLLAFGALLIVSAVAFVPPHILVYVFSTYLVICFIIWGITVLEDIFRGRS